MSDNRYKSYKRILFVLLSVLSFYGLAGMNNTELASNTAVAPGRPDSMAAFNSSHVQVALERLDHRLDINPNDLEALLFKALIYFKTGEMDKSMFELNELIAREPDFHLAHLIKGDLILAATDPVTGIGQNDLLQHLDKQQQEQLHRLRWEAEARLQAYIHQINDTRVPAQLLRLGESVKTAIVVDKTMHRLYVFENMGSGQPPRLLRDFYSTTGKSKGNKLIQGDLKTPEGVYFVTTYLRDEDLEDKYGTGAFPLNYPNEYDQHLGKTGSGIWLHGTDKSFYSRPPRDSEGCVALTNLDLDAVSPYITPGVTPVIITEAVQWVAPDQWHSMSEAALQAVDSWRSDWESGNFSAYIADYARDFWSEGYNLQRWQSRKRAVFNSKTYQKIDLSDISIFKYPPEATDKKAMYVVNFRQSYRSNNFNTDVSKRLYLAQEGGSVKILYEGNQ